MPLDPKKPTIKWRQKIVNGVRQQDKNSLDNCQNIALDDDAIFQIAKRDMPPLFSSDHLVCKPLTRKRSNQVEFCRHHLGQCITFWG